jgi:hypothetical protein
LETIIRRIATTAAIVTFACAALAAPSVAANPAHPECDARSHSSDTAGRCELAEVSTPSAEASPIAPGTQLTGTLDQELASASANAGDAFTLSGVHSQDLTLADATIVGHVAQVERAGQGRPGKIALAFDKIRLKSGDVYSLEGANAVKVEVDTKSNALKEAGGVVAGGVVGRVLLGRRAALAAAAVGYLVAKNNRANVTIPKSSGVVVQVSRALRQAQ